MRDTARSDIERKFRRRATQSIVMLTLWAVFFSSILLSAVNDMYAFIKSDTQLTMEIEDTLSTRELSRLLSSEGIVNHPTLFSLYLYSKGKTELVESFTGTLRLNASMSYREILAVLQNPSSS